MKDGFATVYFDFEDLRRFIIKAGGFQDDAILIMGRPRMVDSEQIEIDVAFSEETEVDPQDWAVNKEKVDAIIDQWKEWKNK